MGTFFVNLPRVDDRGKYVVYFGEVEGLVTQGHELELAGWGLQILLVVDIVVNPGLGLVVEEVAEVIPAIVQIRVLLCRWLGLLETTPGNTFLLEGVVVI